METRNGIIIRALSGFYYVETEDGTVTECRARGVFRKDGMRPLVGDRVEIETGSPDSRPARHSGKMEVASAAGTVTGILPRKNSLDRPPVANIDRLIIVSSVLEPKPNLLVLDKMTAVCAEKGIEAAVLFSKSDLADTSEYTDIYRRCGYTSFGFSSATGENVDRVAQLFEGLCCLTGNSGVGKSSVLNAIAPGLRLETSVISAALGRGRHTTREVSLYHTPRGFIADTPGFSALDFENDGTLTKDELPLCFPEFAAFLPGCRFVNDCSHRKDSGCAVREAVLRGDVPQSRYDSYLAIYDEIRDFKNYEKK